MSVPDVRKDETGSQLWGPKTQLRSSGHGGVAGVSGWEAAVDKEGEPIGLHHSVFLIEGVLVAPHHVSQPKLRVAEIFAV